MHDAVYVHMMQIQLSTVLHVEGEKKENIISNISPIPSQTEIRA